MSSSGDNGTGGMPVMVMAAPPVSMPLDARSMKARIFSAVNKKYKSKMISFFGETIEIRQPSLSAMMDKMEGVDANENIAVWVLTEFAYVPGTDEKVFDTADIESLRSMPAGAEFNRVTAAYREVVDMDADKAEKNSEGTSIASKS